MNALTLYTSPASRGSIARWMLEETGMPYDVKVLAPGVSATDNDYLRINPMGKVPALVHGDTVITETAAICMYLADQFPDTGLAPDHHLRGAYYRWFCFATGPLEAAMTNQMLGFEVPAELTASVGYGRFEQVLDVLEAVLTQQPYMTGDAFSAVDVYLGSQLGLGMRFGAIDKRPAFERYWQQLNKRPACIRAQSLESALG